jgi:hypothetical protein
MENENLNENERLEEEKLGEVAAFALRGPRKGVYQQLLAGSLIKAMRTDDSLKKVYNICMAAYTFKEKDKLNMELVEICSRVCESLINTILERNQPITVAWNFPQTEKNWEKYILPWQRTTLSFYPLLTYYGRRNYPRRYAENDPFEGVGALNRRLNEHEETIKQANQEINELPIHKSFFESTSALSLTSFNVLKSEFSSWAIAKLAETQALIAEHVDPALFREMFEFTMRREQLEEGEGENGRHLV